MTRIGSLCTGYGGLDLAVESVFGGELAWVADNDPGKAKILAHRFPGVPNLGDISETDWSAVEPVGIAAMGFPCKDVSCAGARAGLREGNRSGVWNYCATAIGALRPPLVIIENVRGLHSAGADSNVEWCTWCLGEAGDEHSLRASGAVLGDLADLGYDAEWVTVSASDAGAPHRRERVFILARPAADTAGDESRRNGAVASDGGGQAGYGLGTGHRRASADTAGRRFPARGRGGDGWPAAIGREAVGRPDHGTLEDPDCAASRQWRLPAPGQAAGGWPRADAGRPSGAPAANSPGDGRDEVGTRADLDGRPVPAERGASADTGCDARPEDHEDIAAAAGGGGTAAAHTASRGRGTAGLERGMGPAEHEPRDLAWGDYEPAIRRWEAALGRPAPRPTEPGRSGERLSPRFVEWMMGLPAGWVTDVPGLSRNQQLAALGDGVVPQQAEMALRILAGALEAGEAA